ncbi:MAG: type II toxin-antitoxin system VapC family toxin [Chloroflexi bacterium]|nr:type II toxin-antitoxin system VapC family toxin [Chloroflexota bacterium]
MTAFVVDASVTVAWLLNEEEQAGQGLSQLVEDGAVVPQLWHLEIRNVLLVAERRGRLSAAQAATGLDALQGLPIDTDESPDLASAYTLARTHRLSFYDAVYLELACRRSASLVTLDTALARAAAAEGLPPLPG